VKVPYGGGIMADYLCRTCAFWEGGVFREERHASITQFCRRRAPAVGDNGRGSWPLTLNGDGCGDWVPYAKEQDTE
jgi:hypothetical protein